MGFNFHVGLPGPFSYNKRIGGGKRKGGSTDGAGMGILLIVCLSPILINLAAAAVALGMMYYLCVWSWKASVWSWKKMVVPFSRWTWKMTVKLFHFSKTWYEARKTKAV